MSFTTRSTLKRWLSAPSTFLQPHYHAQTGIKQNDFLFISDKGLKYRIREAKHYDIASLNTCNRQNLPENYSDEFYEAQLARWPDLSLIAENETEVVGYGLGRIETTDSLEKTSTVAIHEHPRMLTYQGHIVSIAINPKFRGHDIALNMMQILHHRFATEYSVNSATLYCRPSNKAAISLYTNKLDYKVEKRICNYYVDSEDACFMTVEDLIDKTTNR